MAVYRPSFVCVLTLRLDDNSLLSTPQTRKFLGLPQIVSTKYPKKLELLFPTDKIAVAQRLQPLSVSINEMPFRTPDRCQASFSWRHLPIDPRSIRGGLIQVYGGTISEDEYANGITELSGDKLLYPHGSVVDAHQNRAMFSGSIDDISIEWGGNGQVVNVSARDFTQHLLDFKMPTAVVNNPPDVTLPINKWIEALLQTNRVISKLFDPVVTTVGFKHNENALVIPSAVSAAIPKKKLRKSVKKKKRRRRPKITGSLNYWDFISDMCVASGVMPNVEDDRIVVRPAGTFFGPDTYVDAKFSRLIDGKVTSIRRFVYGQNIANFSLKRQIHGASTPAVRVVSAVGTKTLTATYPPVEDIPRTYLHPSGKMMKQRILVIPVGGIQDPSALSMLAVQLWNEIARNELTGTIETFDLASSGGDNDDPDILRMRVGDPIEFLVSAQPATRNQSSSDAVTNFYNMSENEAIARIAKLIPMSGGLVDLESAMELYQALKSPNLQPYFRVKSIDHNFNSTSGYSAKIKFHNFFETLWKGRASAFAPFNGE